MRNESAFPQQISHTWMARRREAAALVERGNHSEARRQLCALAQESTSLLERAAAGNDLAVLAAVQGRNLAAIQGCRRALRIQPQQTAATRNLATLMASHPPEAGSSSRPRVAIVSLLFNWPSTGGGTVHTKELADALQADGCEVRHIYAVYESWGLGNVTQPLSVPGVPLHFEAADWTAGAIQDRFRDAVDEFAPDAVIIADSWNTKPLLAEAVADYPYFLRLAALETLCPLNNVRLLLENRCLVQCQRNQLVDAGMCRSCVAQHAHHSGGLHQAERALAGFESEDYPERLQRAYRNAEAVLAVNPTIAHLVRPYCRRVEVVPSGFEPKRFPEPDFGSFHELASRPTRFLFAGLVDELMKGFFVLQDAGRRLWAQRQDWELVVTSDRRPEWDAPFLRWIGWQSQAELPQAIRGCDVLVFPTVAQEALGRTAVEAMACGKPVIASRLGGLPWVVEDNHTGLLVTPGNGAELSAAMSQLIGNADLCRRLGQAGREKFDRDFPWPVIVEKCYRPLLAPLILRQGS